jgi:transposase
MIPKPTDGEGAMKALTLAHQELTREALLRKAEEVPGAWIGIRVAAFLLMLAGCSSTQVAELFGLSRWAVVKWIQRANLEGLEALTDKPRPGRPSQFDQQVLRALDEALSKSPQDYGLTRNRWDGIVVVEYLKRFHQIKVQVRHAQRLIRNLGYSLRRPIYRYVQATEAGVKEFHAEVKKTPSRPKKQR